ncbi:MAG TPA: DNA mismatch repair protein MutT, partial [Naasia sp.]
DDAPLPREELDRFAAKRLARGRNAVLCTHSPVLPQLLDSIVTQAGGERDGRLTRAGILTTAEFTVVHLSAADPRGGVVALETHTPPV